MKLTQLNKPGFDVVSYDEDSDDADRIHGLALVVAHRSGIRVSRNKNLRFVALKGNDVVGAVWVSFINDPASDSFCYDFDVAVSPEARATGLTSNQIGPALINTALADYHDEATTLDYSYVRVWVVNPKLATWLEKTYGFETLGGGPWSEGNPFMIYSGRH